MKNEKIKSMKYWLSVIVVGIILGFALQFVRAWTEPTDSPPGGNLGAPVNTSGNTQIKWGPLFVNGSLWKIGQELVSNIGLWVGGKSQADDFCLNSDPTKCLSNAGSGGSGDCICKIDSQDQFAAIDVMNLWINCGDGWKLSFKSITQSNNDGWGWSKTPIQAYFSCSTSTSVINQKLSEKMLYGFNHSNDSCTSAGGEVVSVSGDKICKMEAVLTVSGPFFNTSYKYECPTGWTRYYNWSKTIATTCPQPECASAALIYSSKTCTTGGHSWSNTAIETCSGANMALTQAQCCVAYDPNTEECNQWGNCNQCTFLSNVCEAKVEKIGCY